MKPMTAEQKTRHANRMRVAEERARKESERLAELALRALDTLAPFIEPKVDRIIEEFMESKGREDREEVLRQNRDKTFARARDLVIDAEALKWLEQVHERLTHEGK